MMALKQALKERMPWLVTLREAAENVYLRTQNPEKIFTRYYKRNRWADEVSRSGPGSNPAQARILAQRLPGLLHEIGCATLLDAPCGDFAWMSTLELGCSYQGCDIVDALVTRNQQLYGRIDRRFRRLDIIRDPLPAVDVILCRDCLVHFSWADTRAALANIAASGSTWFLTTTFLTRPRNRDIPTGAWRPINLQRPPYDFPPPRAVIREECPDGHGAYADKCLALWLITDLPHGRGGREEAGR